MSRLEATNAKNIVRDAGGRIVGRTRLQKVAFLLTASGLDDSFEFTYKHYGPFSEDLASAAREADLLGLLNESEHVANWGGVYSVFQVNEPAPDDLMPSRRALASLAAQADAIELELAATALFLSSDYTDPWEETARRKPEKIGQGRIEKAKALYQSFCTIQTPTPWPAIA